MKNLFEKNKVLKLAIITYRGAILPFGFAKTDYYFMSPGTPYTWDISIEDEKTFEFDGNL